MMKIRHKVVIKSCSDLAFNSLPTPVLYTSWEDPNLKSKIFYDYLNFVFDNILCIVLRFIINCYS